MALQDCRIIGHEALGEEEPCEPAHVDGLIALGFSRAVSEIGLREAKGRLPDAAYEWLVDHGCLQTP